MTTMTREQTRALRAKARKNLLASSGKNLRLSQGQISRIKADNEVQVRASA